MKLTRTKKIVLIIALAAFVALLFNSNIAFAAINTEYSGTDTVPDTALNDAVSESTLLELLAKLVYAVGRLLEWILGTIFSLLTGTSDFPWADKIVFNAVPLLDVNFINPGAGSFVIQPAIQGALKNLYATIMTLAITFFGIVVLITAIKLVLSTIASDKAKYKQAIVDWLVGFVLVFCIHYFISFVFYLNEQLVIVASKIVTSQLSGAREVAKVQEDALASELIEHARSLGVKYRGELVADILERNSRIVTTWMNGLDSSDTTKGFHEALMKYRPWTAFGADVAVNSNTQYERLAMIVTWAASENVSVSRLREIRDRITIMLGYAPRFDHNYGGYSASGSQAIETKYIKEFFVNKNTNNFDSDMYEYFANAIESTNGTYKGKVMRVGGKAWLVKDERYRDKTIIGDKIYILSSGACGTGYMWDTTQFSITSDLDTSTFYWTDLLDEMIILKGASDTSSGTAIAGSGASVTASRLITDLATYFRYNAYNKERRTTNTTGVTDGDEIRIQNMLMYAILVVQSLILFIAYIKRLFYVILLAMMAPVVVVFDFFQKFGK